MKKENVIGWRVEQDCTLEYKNYESGEDILIPDGEDCPNDWPGIVFFEEHPSIFKPLNKDMEEINIPTYSALKAENERLSRLNKELVEAKNSYANFIGCIWNYLPNNVWVRAEQLLKKYETTKP